MSACAAAVAPPLVPGTELIPDYRVIAHLSRAQVLDVYEVFSQERAASCVAKTLRPDQLAHERGRQRLRQEGELLTRLTHPHLVRAYEVVERPRLVVIQETLVGATLEHLLASSSRRLPAVDVVLLGLQLCSAMVYLHAQGFLHLDLKPSNIVGECGRAKVLDLSLARPPGPGRPGVGTRAYLSPEQARGEPLTEASDTWGIGVVLYEAAAGLRAFPEEDDGERRYPQLERRADPVRRHRRLPRGLAEAIDACLEPVPAARPSVRELAVTLESLLGP